MFELGTPLPVERDRSPVVLPVVEVLGPQVDHGFDRERMPHLHEPGGLVFGLVGHVGQRMELLTHPVPYLPSHY